MSLTKLAVSSVRVQMRWCRRHWYEPKAFVRVAALVVSARHTDTHDNVVRVHLRNETFLAYPVDKNSVPGSQHGVFSNLRRKMKKAEIRMSAEGARPPLTLKSSLDRRASVS